MFDEKLDFKSPVAMQVMTI